LTPYRAASSLESILRNNKNLEMGTGDQGSESTTGRGPDVEDEYPVQLPEAGQQPAALIKYDKQGRLRIWDPVKEKYVLADLPRRLA
jgi:hypothetical protein